MSCIISISSPLPHHSLSSKTQIKTLKSTQFFPKMALDLKKSPNLPPCKFKTNPTPIYANPPTPLTTLDLSPIDDQDLLQFYIKFLYLYKRSVGVEKLKASLARAISEYYPLAGRVRLGSGKKPNGETRRVVECNGEGALFVEAEMEYTAMEFLEIAGKPSGSWNQLLYRVDGIRFLDLPVQSFFDLPPILVQVTNLKCGGMILCIGINHHICDGIGGFQFLKTWAHISANPDSDLPVKPFHERHLLKPRSPLKIPDTHPVYVDLDSDNNNNNNDDDQMNILQYIESQPLVPVSVKFTSSQIQKIKQQTQNLKCTSFEALTTHTWRSWVKSLDLPRGQKVKLQIAVSVRKIANPPLPEGYYGNGQILGCAESTVNEVTDKDFTHVVKLVQQAKSELTDETVRELVDMLEGKRVKIDLSKVFMLSMWGRLGLENLDFGEGMPLHFGPLVSTHEFCLLVPVAGEPDSLRAIMSVPESAAEKFEYYMTQDS